MTALAAVENEYLRRFPGEAANQLDGLSDSELDGALTGVDADLLAVVLEYLSPFKAQMVFDRLEPDRKRAILERAAPRVIIALLGDASVETRDILLDPLRPAVRDDLRRLLAFPDNSAGQLMDRSFVGADADMSVGDALRRLQASSIRRARSLFVITPDQRLAGRVDLQDLVLASPDDALRDYLQPVEGVVGAMAPREEVVDLLDSARLDSVPVLDANGRLMGVVRYRSLFRAIEDVATADLQTMVGASADERALSGPAFAVRRRLPWLHVNLVTAFMAASVVGLFEPLIARFTALAVLLPVVAGQSGNAGSQALAVTIRGLALKEVGIREWRRVLSKEVLVGITDGLALACTCGLGVFVWSRSIGLALVIGVAMVLSMVAAGIAGALVPMLLTRVGQDPATASSIILTTVTDVSGFFSFLGTATLLSFLL